MSSSEPGARANALEVFASWLSRRESGEKLEFEDLLRAHPHLAAELADLEATWKRLAAASESAQFSSAVHERVEGRRGEETAPKVSSQARQTNEVRGESSDPASSGIFSDWLARREQGGGQTFEELLREHAAHAADLNRMHADWHRAKRVLDRPEVPGDAGHTSLTERLQMRYGEGVDPKVHLRGSDERAERFSSEVIQRLSGRSGSFGRYQLEGEIARGGMGAILRIWDEDLRRYLAMKVILGQVDARSNGSTPPVETKKVARFLEEAQVTGQLDHPGIVPVHELGLDPDGRLYFTMKLVKGSSLKEVFDQVAQGREGWTQTKALGVLLKVCEAMAYAHDKGVIHRDLKPANIMVGKFGEVHVMDWGLARILDKEDEKDIRIRGDTQQITSLLQSDRGEQRTQTPDSPLYTMDGDVVGTPAYMPPEQAAGKASEVGPHSDVYALGAMLYHLLAGHTPYVPKGARLNNYAVWGLVQQGPPPSIAALSPETSVELIAVCEKAMARNWRERYRDMSELAADLSASLEHRVVGAYQTGAWAEAKKWIERNKALAASLAAAIAILVAGIIGTTTFAVDAKQQSTRADAQAEEAKRLAAAESEARRDADHNAEEARRNATAAQQNAARAVEQERIAARRANDVLSLSAIQDLEDLVARADKLWPAHPENISRFEEWLSDARTLIDGRPSDESKGQRGRPGLAAHKKQLAELEQRALPQTEAERNAERASHPRAGELAELRAELEWTARMLGKSPWPSEPEEEAALEHLSPAPADAKSWNLIAWTLVRPDRESYGGEVKALLCARRAVEGARAEERYTYRDTLAWALFRVGRFDEAVEQERKSLEEAPEQEREAAEASFKSLESVIGTWRTSSGGMQPAQEQKLSELEAKAAELQRVISSSLEWNFANSEDRWWHLQLAKLIANLEAFADPKTGLLSSGVSDLHGWGVEKRMEFARTITERSVTGAEASRRWQDAIASIRDVQQCPRYAGLVLAPELGLMPIGRDKDSGLWEFADLQTGEPAVRGEDGKLVVNGEMGLVFVLIPGGTFWMGAQRTDPTGKNFDPQANGNESPVHEVTLSPYMLSKYEMTQGQWLRISGHNPSAYGPRSPFNHEHDLTHPVEQVTWTGCMELLGWLGLQLPTEAQWEFACRGGTDTPWSTGRDRESLRGRVNLVDLTAKRLGASWAQILDWPDLEDGWEVHAPVGIFAANPYGLHEVHGNLCEWCRDGYNSYFADKRVDPLAQWIGVPERVVRGGSFTVGAAAARSTSRTYAIPGTQLTDLGLRPARELATR